MEVTTLWIFVQAFFYILHLIYPNQSFQVDVRAYYTQV